MESGEISINMARDGFAEVIFSAVKRMRICKSYKRDKYVSRGKDEVLIYNKIRDKCVAS